MAEEDKLLVEAKEAFDTANEAEKENRETYKEDVRFALESRQWDEKDVERRKLAGEPTLTINMLKPRIRQVVNDTRQNKPSIKTHPADSGADPETAKVIDGLIRNIEYTSKADVAYDTAAQCAAAGGFGYIRVGLDYVNFDSFDKALKIERVANPLTVYGDPSSMEADSANWNTAFVVTHLNEAQWDAQWGKKSKKKLKWKGSSAQEWGGENWRNTEEDTCTVAEWWKRERYEKRISQFFDHRDQSIITLDDETITKVNEDGIPTYELLIQQKILEYKRERMADCWKVKQHFMSGAEILESRDWPGQYIPIVPVYGEEFIDTEGKRLFRSIIYDSKDPQRQLNYWRSTATLLTALAPKAPYIGKKGAFDHDQERWNTINSENHPYVEYEGGEMPMRQPLDGGVAAGALQEAMNASEDIKATTGIYDASMGAKSNETSGRAILARQREGDVSTFHIQDNVSRAIRHLGVIIIDLLPKVYTEGQMIRILGEDDKPSIVPVGQNYPATDPKTGQPMVDERGQAIMRMHDFSAGKYDLVVKAGPSYTTRREEAAEQMTAMVQAFPASAPIIAPELAKNLDWPGADEIAEKMEALNQPQIPPELQQQIEEGQKKIQQLEEENTQLKMDQSVDAQKVENEKILQQQKIDDAFELEKIKLENQKEIELEKVKLQRDVAIDNHNIAVEDHERSHELEMTKADAVDETGPDGKTKKKPLNAAVMNAVSQLREDQSEMRRQIAELARIVSAPTELIRDPKTGRASGSRKVLN